MKKIYLILLTFAFISVSMTTACGQSARVSGADEMKEWNPQRTWVYFVGLLEWKDKQRFASFPQKNRRDAILLDVLRSRGVPENQIVYLKDSEATAAKVAETFPKFLQQAKAGDTVIVYFCGHGYRSADNKTAFLATFDAGDKTAGWLTGDVPAVIEKNFKGTNAMLLADNCYSGALAEDVKALKNPRVSYGVMTSAHFNSFSTGNWTFTESLIYAFRGDAGSDDDGDGKVTFAELEANAAEDLLFGEEQLAQFAFTGDFNRSAIVSTARKNNPSRIGERVESYSVDGFYKGFIRDSKNDKFQVRYYGYEETDDEWVTAKMIRRAAPKQHKIGAKVDVNWIGKWFAARIADVKGGAHLVKYDGYGAEYDEWVPSKRIRETAANDGGGETIAQNPADSEYKIGALVEAADFQRNWYKSKILAAKDGKYLVHYFGWEKKWDEWVTPDKIRQSNDYDFGRETEVVQNGKWYRAIIIESRSGGSEYLVSYVGYDEDEWVRADRVRDRSDSGWYDSRYGKRIEVLSKGKWYEARILDKRRDEFYVHYEGYGDSWNEWVKKDRVREAR